MSRKTSWLIAASALALGGCTAVSAWWTVPGHQSATAAVAAVGGAVYAVEKAGVGAFELGEKAAGAARPADKPAPR